MTEATAETRGAAQMEYNVGEALKAARKANGFTQAQLGEMVQADASTISKIERGKTNPPVDLFRKLVIALEESANTILEIPVSYESVGSSYLAHAAGVIMDARDSLDAMARGIKFNSTIGEAPNAGSCPPGGPKPELPEIEKHWQRLPPEIQQAILALVMRY